MFCEVGSSTDDCQTGDCKQTYLAGLVSWGNGKCGKDGVAVVTEVSAYVKWIDEIEKSVDYHYFNKLAYGDAGYGLHATSYGAERYGSHGRHSFGSRGGLSPYYGNRYQRIPVSAYGKTSRYGNYVRPYYKKPASRYGHSTANYGNLAVPYSRNSYNSNGRYSYGKNISPYGGSIPPHFGRYSPVHGSYRGGPAPFYGRPVSHSRNQSVHRPGKAIY